LWDCSVINAGIGLTKLLRYNFAKHLVFSLLKGRPVIIFGTPQNENAVKVLSILTDRTWHQLLLTTKKGIGYDLHSFYPWFWAWSQGFGLVLANKTHPYERSCISQACWAF